MALSFVGFGFANSASPPTPSGARKGDLVCVVAHRTANATAPTVPAGWNTIASRAVIPALVAAWAIWDGNPIPAFTNATSCQTMAWTGYEVGSAYGGSVTGGATSTTITFPAVTLVRTNNTSHIVRAVGDERPDVAIPTPASHTLIRTNATADRPAYASFRIGPMSAADAAVSVTVSRSSAYSAISFEIKAAPTAPASSPTPTFSGVAFNSVTVNWAAPSGSTERVTVQRATASGGPWTNVADLAAADLSYTDTSVVSGTTYWYRIVSVNGAGSFNGNAASVAVPLLTIASSGIASAEAFGSTLVDAQTRITAVGGITSAEGFGSLAAAKVLTLLPSGIDTSESFGAVNVSAASPITTIAFGPSDSIPSEESFGSSSLARHVSELQEDFSAPLDPNKWFQTWNPDSFISGGRFVLPASDLGGTADPLYSTGLRTVTTYVLGDGESVWFESDVSNALGGTFTVTMFEDSYATQIQWWVQGSTMSLATSIPDGTWTQQDLAYDPVAHKWWRWRRATDILHFETSPDGITWTDQWAATTWAPGGWYLDFQFQPNTPTGGGGSVSIDNINVQGTPAIAPTGIGSSEAFGTATVLKTYRIFATGIASAEGFGNLVTGQRVALTGIASAESFGTPTLRSVRAVLPTGIASQEAFGTQVVNKLSTVSATGIASSESFGTLRLSNRIAGLGTIASAEGFGTPTLRSVKAVAPTGIPSAEAFGAARVNRTMPLAGIASAEAFGTSKINRSIKATGVSSAETFGTLTVNKRYAVSTAGISSAESFGASQLRSVNRLVITSVPSAESFGTPSLSGILVIYATGVPSGEAFGFQWTHGPIIAVRRAVGVTDAIVNEPATSVVDSPAASTYTVELETFSDASIREPLEDYVEFPVRQDAVVTEPNETIEHNVDSVTAVIELSVLTDAKEL